MDAVVLYLVLYSYHQGVSPAENTHCVPSQCDSREGTSSAKIMSPGTFMAPMDEYPIPSLSVLYFWKPSLTLELSVGLRPPFQLHPILLLLLPILLPNLLYQCPPWVPSPPISWMQISASEFVLRESAHDRPQSHLSPTLLTQYNFPDTLYTAPQKETFITW